MLCPTLAFNFIYFLICHNQFRIAIVTGYEEIIPQLELPDRGVRVALRMQHRHVLAAAIKSRSRFIVTFNIRDFPVESLAVYDIQVLHPDNFILRLLTINHKPVCQAAEKQRQRLKNPPKTIEEYLATLEQQGLPQSAALMRQLCYEN